MVTDDYCAYFAFGNFENMILLMGRLHKMFTLAFCNRNNWPLHSIYDMLGALRTLYGYEIVATACVRVRVCAVKIVWKLAIEIEIKRVTSKFKLDCLN